MQAVREDPKCSEGSEERGKRVQTPASQLQERERGRRR